MPPMAHVLHMIDSATPRDMLDQLAMLADAEDTIVSIGPPPRAARSMLDVRSVHCPMGLAVLAARGLHECVPTGGVVHAWSPRAAWAGQAVADAHDFRLVVSLPTASALPALGAVRDALTHAPGRMVATVPTQASRQALLDEELPPEVVAVLPPAVEAPGDRDRPRRDVREQLGIGDDEALLVAPAEMIRPAGHKYASWVHAILRNVLDGLRLMLPGRGPVETFVRNFAHTTGYDDEIHVTGDRFTLSEAMAAADIAVFFQDRDCGVHTLAAAMSAGLPIVACRTPDAAEMIQHERTGLLARPKSPRSQSAEVLRLLDDRDVRARLGRAAAEFAGRYFHPGSAHRRLREIYAAALPEHSEI